MRKAASCWRDGVSKVFHEAFRDGPGCPKSSPKLTFGVPGRHFLRPKCHNAVCTKNILFIMFLPHWTGPGSLFSAPGQPSQRSCHTVRYFSRFFGRSGRPSVPQGHPKGTQGLPKPPREHPKIVLKSMLGPIWAPRAPGRCKQVPTRTEMCPKLMPKAFFLDTRE